MSLDPTDILLPDLPGSNLLLHFSRFTRISSEEQQAGGETIKAVNCSQVLQTQLLGEDENYRVVAVTAAGVNLETGCGLLDVCVQDK